MTQTLLRNTAKTTATTLTGPEPSNRIILQVHHIIVAKQHFPCNDLHELILTITRYTCDTDNLSGTDRQIYILQGYSVLILSRMI